MAGPTEISAEDRRRIGETGWYHVLELPGGIVTDGWFDLRPQVADYGLPEDMSGMRALDVGTWDGFWAFEMERRGADVVCLDLDDESELDWPPRRRPQSFSSQPRGEGFRIASEILGSKAERLVLSIYDATPEELGTFDLVFCGSVLIHLRDQFLALERIAGLCSGLFISAEEYDRLAGLLPAPLVRFRADVEKSVVFWRPSIRAWKAMISSAGFDHVERFGGRLDLHSKEGFKVPHAVFHARRG